MTPGYVEVARSFTYKLNCGNYESRDFFCSQKAECLPVDAERVSDAIYAFCKAQVMKAVKEAQEELRQEYSKSVKDRGF